MNSMFNECFSTQLNIFNVNTTNGLIWFIYSMNLIVKYRISSNCLDL